MCVHVWFSCLIIHLLYRSWVGMDLAEDDPAYRPVLQIGSIMGSLVKQEYMEFKF